MIARGRAAGLLAALVTVSSVSVAQTGDAIPLVRHILGLDYARVQRFHRVYDMVVITGDSVVSIGTRGVTLVEAMIADSTGDWMLVESRSGVVSSVDSILLASDLRPLRWRSTVGGATLDMLFSADSMTGTIRIGDATNHMTLAIPPDLVVSWAVAEMLAALLPLAPDWADSASALVMSVSGAAVEPSEVFVSGEDSVVVTPEAPARPCWVLAMRAGAKESRAWVDRETAEVLRVRMLLPSHVGAILEYRLRPQPTTEQ
ncbi:MAG: hypothetical protein AABZ80_01570 [Gemmatimonadota bacterium]